MKNYRLIGLGVVLLILASAFVLGQEQQQMQVRGVLVSDQHQNETALWVELRGELLPGHEVVLESSVGDYREIHTVKKVLDTTIILGERLMQDFPAGSRILQ